MTIKVELVEKGVYDLWDGANLVGAIDKHPMSKKWNIYIHGRHVGAFGTMAEAKLEAFKRLDNAFSQKGTGTLEDKT